jgi:hypothetical protein
MLLECVAFLFGLSFVVVVLILTVRLSRGRQPGHDARRIR